MSGPRLTQLPLWERHEQRVLTVLRGALDRLSASGVAGRGELDLNDELVKCINAQDAHNKRDGRPYVGHPIVAGAFMPPAAGSSNASSNRSEPDLQWQIVDDHAPDPRRGVRSFVIECKLLGSSPTGRNLNRLYVTEGVRRFAGTKRQYGRDVRTGAMVGYMQSSTPAHILKGVNAALRREGIVALALPTPPNPRPIVMGHGFDRPFEVTPFRLFHFWID